MEKDKRFTINDICPNCDSRRFYIYKEDRMNHYRIYKCYNCKRIVVTGKNNEFIFKQFFKEITIKWNY